MENNLKLVSIKLNKFKNSCFLNFDNGEYLLISIDIVLANGLKKGDLIDINLYEKLCQEQSLIDTRQAAYNYATYKPRTEYEIISKLKSEKYSLSNINLAIEKLRELDLINDEKYALNYAQGKIKLKNYSFSKIKLKLKEKGVSESIIKKTLENITQEHSSYEIAEKSAIKKMRSIQLKALKKQEQLLRDHLIREGFSYQIMKELLNSIFENRQKNEDLDN